MRIGLGGFLKTGGDTAIGHGKLLSMVAVLGAQLLELDKPQLGSP